MKPRPLRGPHRSSSNRTLTRVSAPGSPRSTTRLSSRPLITDIPISEPSRSEKSFISAKDGMQSMDSLVLEPPTKT